MMTHATECACGFATPSWTVETQAKGLGFIKFRVFDASRPLCLFQTMPFFCRHLGTFCNMARARKPARCNANSLAGEGCSCITRQRFSHIDPGFSSRRLCSCPSRLWPLTALTASLPAALTQKSSQTDNPRRGVKRLVHKRVL
jgi:hypothetical protein